MKTIDRVVLKETRYIATWVLIFSAITQAVFLIIGHWNDTVLFGNLFSGAAVILNFLAMGITVWKAVDKEEKDAKQAMKASGMARTFCLFLVVVLGVLLPCFSTWTVILPLFFPRVAIALRPLWDKNREKEGSDTREI